MSFKCEVGNYPVAGVSRLLATNGGAHILSVELTTDAWNGAIVGVGDYVDFEYYEESTPTTFKAHVIDEAANGNYYVQVDEAVNAFLVYNPPVVEADWSNAIKAESNFYLKSGEVARAHELKKYDVFELSANGFSGTVAKGKSITSVAGKKPVIA